MALSVFHSIDEDSLAYALVGLNDIELRRFARCLASAILSRDELTLKPLLEAMESELAEWEATA